MPPKKYVYEKKLSRGDANAPAVLALKSKIHGYLDEVPIAVTRLPAMWIMILSRLLVDPQVLSRLCQGFSGYSVVGIDLLSMMLPD